MTFEQKPPQIDDQAPPEPQQRGWLGLRSSDWAQAALVLILGTIGPATLLQWALTGPPARQALGSGLALAAAAASGAALIYIFMRRQLATLRQIEQALLQISRRALAIGHDLAQAAEATSAAQQRIAALERALADYRAGRGLPPDDALDRLILALLTEDPDSTDEEIGRHPSVSLERSQVTRRRQRLAAAGYVVARKRQGQRPSRRS